MNAANGFRQSLLEEHGGRVLAGEHGSLRFQTPERFHANNSEDSAIRRKVIEAVKTLDAARPTVHALLKAKRELPDLPAAAGGGVAA
jgi:hypothetical protein